MKRKIAISVIIVFFLLAIIGGIIIFCKLEGKTTDLSEDGLTRYEWIQLLTEKFGMTEYINEEPYTTDVERNNEYFSYVQSACEWGIIEKSTDFRGSEFVTGKYVALTAMKVIGQAKIQAYFETMEEIDNSRYIEIAIEYDLIDKKELRKSISKERAEVILNRTSELYVQEFWRDDYEEVKLKDGVVEIVEKDIYQYNQDYSEITLAQEISSTLKVGDIIILKQNTGMKVAKRIRKIDIKGQLVLADVGLNEVVDSIEVSDITTITFEDIINYYGIENTEVKLDKQKVNKLENNSVIPLKTKKEEYKNKGFEIAVSTKDVGNEKILHIEIKDNESGIKAILPTNEIVNEDEEFSFSLNVDSIYMASQVKYSVWKGVEYADIAVDIDTELSGKVQIEDEKKITLYETPVPVGTGFVGVDFGLYLVFAVDGSISIKTEVPLQSSVCYEKGKGLRNFNFDLAVSEPQIEAESDLSAKIRVQPTVVFLSVVKVIDAEVDVGIVANVNMVTQSNSQTCIDMVMAYPVLSIVVNGKDGADTLVERAGVSIEWEIFDKDNAINKKRSHTEIIEGRIQEVEECTFKPNEINNTKSDNIEMKEKEKEDVKGVQLVHTYKTSLGDESEGQRQTFWFDYPDNWKIESENVYGVGKEIEESVVISNDRGVTITYRALGVEHLGGNGRSYTDYTVSKISDARFVPIDSEYSSLGNFIVAHIQSTASMHADVDEKMVSNGKLTEGNYAVLPQSYIGEHTYVNGLGGYWEEFSFNYPLPCMCIAEAPKGGFTESEREEVIAILQSFRNAP